ncbi:hypothetical protein L1887_36326 [Cichorium endivia]|nr:hypothetical protein L1887_36326 [Cichorium endivia]
MGETEVVDGIGSSRVLAERGIQSSVALMVCDFSLSILFQWKDRRRRLWAKREGVISILGSTIEVTLLGAAEMCLRGLGTTVKREGFVIGGDGNWFYQWG